MKLECRWPDGSLAWEEELENRLFNQGCQIALNYIYCAVTTPFLTNWYGRLFGGAPADTDTLSTLAGEPGGGIGYSPVAWVRGTVDFTLASLVGGKMQVPGAKKTFGPASTSAWPTVTTFVFASTSDNSGNALARFTMSTPRTIQVGQTLDVTPTGVIYGVTS